MHAWCLTLGLCGQIIGKMGVMVICAFRPKLGKAADLLEVVRDHLPILRRLGLATDRPTLAMKAKDGTIVEVFEWVSEEAIRNAHGNPEVLALWQRYEACSDYIKLNEVPETAEMFAGYEPIDL